MQDFEKLGLFYLGREFDVSSGKRLDNLVLYDSRDLVTHAVCVGMTGSGKTGLCLSLIEEAAIDGVPVIAIDPKGDLGNLLLTFPSLAATDFRPWIDEDEARRAIAELQSAKLLAGVRGAKAADVDALVATVMNVQRLAMDLADEIRELDINPLVVRPRGAVALDALVVKK